MLDSSQVAAWRPSGVVIRVRRRVEDAEEQERSSSGASSDCDTDRDSDTDSGFSTHKFHLRELETPPLPPPDPPHPHNISSIVSLLVQGGGRWEQEEAGRAVLYTTSMGVVRTTFERCRRVRKILDTLLVRVEERDLFMNRGFQLEVRERLGGGRVELPQLFVEGRLLGGAEVIEQLNEIGHLRELLRPYKKQCVGGVCSQCGGHRHLLCPVCGGSKKSPRTIPFSQVALRCVTCDESGLVRCPLCIHG